MICEHLWESAENIVQELGDEIKRNGKNIRLRQSVLGWQYGGLVFESGIKRLKDDMMTTKGYKVLECTAFHFIKPARIRNPTNRYLLLPMEGSANLKPGRQGKPGGPLSTLFVYLIHDEPILEAGEGGLDMICMALEGKDGDNSVDLNVGVKYVE